MYRPNFFRSPVGTTKLGGLIPDEFELPQRSRRLRPMRFNHFWFGLHSHIHIFLALAMVPWNLTSQSSGK